MQPERVTSWKLRATGTIALVLGIPFLLMLGCHRLMGPFTYYSDPIRMRIVDEQTQRPIAGAVAVATWWQEGWNQKLLHNAEAASDASGNLVIPAMPRKLRYPLTRLEWRDPWIVVYKPGYGPRVLHNKDAYIEVARPAGTGPVTQTMADGRIVTTGPRSNTSRRFSYWDEQTVGLVPLKRLRDEAQVWDWVEGEIDIDDVPPEEFPKIWGVLIEGYDRLPPEHKPKDSADPRVIIESWKSWRSR